MHRGQGTGIRERQICDMGLKKIFSLLVLLITILYLLGFSMFRNVSTVCFSPRLNPALAEIIL